MKYKMTVYYDSGLQPSREEEFMDAVAAYLDAQQDTKFEGSYVQVVSIGQREEAIKLASSVLKNEGDKS